MSGDNPAIPAATLIVLRDTDHGPEALMVERAATMAFAGGALVFPGGRVDPGDHAIAAQLGGDPEDGAARVAAIRETIEEAGLAVGIDSALTIHREALLRGEPAEPLLPAKAFDFGALTPFARWRPDHVRHRIFDTRFYLARAPEGLHASADGRESVRLFWARPADTLAMAAEGRARVIFPTRCNLERLARYRDVAHAIADAGRYTVRTITPWIEERGGTPHLCIPNDQGYPVTSHPIADVERA